MIEGLDKGTIIALCSFLGLLVAIMVPFITFAVNLLLAPVKAEQRELKSGQSLLKQEFQTGQSLLRKDFQNLESKLDLLLADKK